MIRLSQTNGLILLVFLSLVSIFISLYKGSFSISFYQLKDTLLGHGTPILNDIILTIRLPRTLSAFVTGALLSLSGALMQVLLKNPLADPYVLGISGGASVVSLCFILLGYSGMMLALGAWVGSLLAIFFVFLLTKRQNRLNPTAILLTGIALQTGFSAMISFILVTSSDNALHGMLYWLLGDLSNTHLPLVEGFILIFALVWTICFSKEFNALMRGEREARALGVSTIKLQIQSHFLCGLLTASAVGLAGCIGFLGLIVPHVFRLLFGVDHRFLLPGCVFLGGSLLTLADTLSRILFAPIELPVGIMMALIGIPVFLFLLQKNETYS